MAIDQVDEAIAQFSHAFAARRPRAAPARAPRPGARRADPSPRSARRSRTARCHPAEAPPKNPRTSRRRTARAAARSSGGTVRTRRRRRAGRAAPRGPRSRARAARSRVEHGVARGDELPGGDVRGQAAVRVGEHARGRLESARRGVEQHAQHCHDDRRRRAVARHVGDQDASRPPASGKKSK